MWRWRRTIHSSWLIAVSCAFFVCGVAASLAVRVPWWAGLGAVLLLAASFWIRRLYVLALIVVGAVVLGMGYGSAHLGERDAYSQWVGKAAKVEGRIKEDPTKSPSGAMSLQLDAVVIDDTPLPGAIFASVRGASSAKRGDIVLVEGEVREGFGNFPVSVTAMGVKAIVRPVPGDVGRVVRDWFADKVRVLLPEPQASLGIGFLTGQKSSLPEELSEAMKIVGLTHIVVASGYNLTILVRMARRLFVRVSKFLSAVSSGAMMVMFMAVTGLSPSMTRAGLVSGISLLAWYYGHKLHPFILLPFAAAITVALNPSYVWGDLGWQLSFAAFAGVMIVAPLLQRYFFGQKEPGTLRQILGETIAAHIVTIPIIALSFGTISHVAIIANLLVVPLVPLAMLLTFICGVWSIIGLPFGWLIATPTDWLLGYMVQAATFVSELSWAQSELTVMAGVWAVYILGITGACVWMWRATKYDFRGTNMIL